MTDKQLSNWVLAQALRDAAYSTKTGRIAATGVFAHVRKLFVQQPESAAHQYMKQVVAKDMEKVYKALGRVQPSHSDADYPACSGNPLSCPENEGHGCCNIQQPGAARGDPPMWTKEPVEALKRIEVLGGPASYIARECLRRLAEQPARDGTCSRLCAETGQCDNNCAPQPADGEAVAVVGEEWNPIRTSKRLVAIFNKKVPLGAKLYLRPTRGVEVTDKMVSDALAAYHDGQGAKIDEFEMRTMRAALEVALSGVQR